MALKIVSLNTRGLQSCEKRRAIFDKHRFHADLLILQETHSSKEIETIWENEWGGRIVFSHGTTAARGIAILIRKELKDSIENIFTDSAGRVIIIDISIKDVVVTVAAIYAPNKDSPSFFEELEELLRARSEHKIIIGDFNLVLDVDKDRENTYNNNNNALLKLESIIEDFKLVDVWRSRHEEKREFSWMKKGSYPIKASRIDYALVSGGMDQYTQMIQYLSSVFTDHRAVYMVIEIGEDQRGVGYWKMNVSLLREKDYVDKINLEIQQTIDSMQHKDPRVIWEKLKQRIKEATIRYSRQKSSEEKLVIAQLSEKINEYEANLPLCQEDNLLLENSKEELEERTLTRVRGIMFRSKVKWYEEGEKNTKYFYSLEKMRYNAKTCYKLIDDQNKQLDCQAEILKAQEKYYQDLYEEDTEVQFTLHNKYDVKVPEEVRIQQDTQITEKEIKQAIHAMNNNKTPGQDGIPIDFYKVFWSRLQDIFYAMILLEYEEQQLHETAREGILNLIPKPNKDSRYIKNLRPITLLNTDYKIIEKAVANKMMPAMKNIINKDQRGFMEDRRISVNIRKMLDIMYLAEKEDLEAVVLSLDFVKCFDKCSFKILHGSLDFFQFGVVVKEWTKILYKDFRVKIQNNGNFSNWIKIKKGVHQGGCCLSVYFLVIAEILALSLRDNQDIEGITFRDIRNLLNQFADDMDIFSICTKKSLEAIQKELDCFRLQSGFTVSYDKTTMYRIGSLRHSNAQMYDLDQFKWSNEDITVLGVTVAHEDIVDKNYQSIIQKTSKTLNAWYNRGLSLIGKVQVVNTLVASLFVYKMMVLPIIPRPIEKRIDNMIREFLWGGKKAKIAYATLQNSKEDGGLCLVNLSKKDMALKTTWPKILAQEIEYAGMVYDIMKVSELGREYGDALYFLKMLNTSR